MMVRYVLSKASAACLGAAILGMIMVDTAVMAAPCLSRAKGPTAGSYGFDWLKPSSAVCTRLQPEGISQFRSCNHQTNGTFGLKDPALACRRSEHSEVLIYVDKATCERNLDVMKSNGP